MIRMIATLAAVSALAFVATSAPIGAQPVDGDLIITTTLNLGPGRFFKQIGILDLRTGTNTTLVQTPGDSLTNVFGAVRMATDNQSVMVMGETSKQKRFLNLSPQGRLTTVATMPSQARGPSLGDLRLDHDNRWIFMGIDDTSLLSLDDSTGAISTLFNAGPLPGSIYFSDFEIWREPGQSPYVLVNPQSFSSPPGPRLFGADRNGIVTTLVGGPGTTLVGMHQVSRDGDGTLLAVSNEFFSSTLVRISTGLAVTTLRSFPQVVSGLRVDQDGTLLVYETPRNGPHAIERLSPAGIVLKTYPLPANVGLIYDFEIYGSRRLRVSGRGTPGATVNIVLQSLRPGDGGRSYHFAASLGRHPGHQFPAGRLNLAADSLFFLTAANAVPAVFVNFAGQTSATGQATASIRVPANLPSGSNIPIFVAGIIFDSSGVRTVTNTHWFVLE